MLRREPFDRGETPVQTIPDTELGLAAILVGVVVLLATILVPIVG
jgi:preprotein translocase subunit Sec61beta